MRRLGRANKVLRKTGVTVLGWLLLLAGVAALALPGPGLLLLLSGMVILSQEYDWAARRVEPIKMRAFAVAAAGVSNRWRIAGSMLGALCVMAVGVFWWVDPRIPQWWIIGPDLPFGGWASGSGIVISGIVAAVLVVYSVRRFGGKTEQEAAAEGRFVPDDEEESA